MHNSDCLFSVDQTLFHCANISPINGESYVEYTSSTASTPISVGTLIIYAGHDLEAPTNIMVYYNNIPITYTIPAFDRDDAIVINPIDPSLSFQSSLQIHFDGPVLFNLCKVKVYEESCVIPDDMFGKVVYATGGNIETPCISGVIVVVMASQQVVVMG